MQKVILQVKYATDTFERLKGRKKESCSFGIFLALACFACKCNGNGENFLGVDLKVVIVNCALECIRAQIIMLKKLLGLFDAGLNPT